MPSPTLRRRNVGDGIHGNLLHHRHAHFVWSTSRAPCATEYGHGIWSEPTPAILEDFGGRGDKSDIDRDANRTFALSYRCGSRRNVYRNDPWNGATPVHGLSTATSE